jgi:NADP-dependent 3-hydroxy acid dehydrogenase YdfG
MRALKPRNMKSATEKSNPLSTPEPPDTSQSFRLDDRHALVTGGASGIGEAVVREFVRAGAFVWIADINLAAAESLACSVGAARALHLDVTSSPSIVALWHGLSDWTSW